jgi:CDP-glycerol glycerophosphotransferase (TagB/SpsB family)
MAKKKTVLFGGYAPVHFVCFKPIYDALVKVPGVEVYVTGGKRFDKKDGTVGYDAKALYRPFGVPANRILPLSAIAKRSFDMTFAAHTSGFFPKKTKTKVQVFHGVSFRNLAIREDQKQYDALFISGPYMMRGFQKRVFKGRSSKLLPIGFVKVDRLKDGSLDRRAILKKLGLKGDRKVLLYAPTGDKRNSLELMGEDVIARIRKANRWDLILKLHDHPKDRETNWPKKLAKHLGPHVKLVRNDYDVVPYLYVADLLISDASSVANEYALMDRPIVFLDVPRLIAKARRKGAMVDLGTWGRRGGTLVRKPSQVVGAIARALANPGRGSKIRQAMAKDLFFDPGHATERAVEWVCRRLGVKVTALRRAA